MKLFRKYWNILILNIDKFLKDNEINDDEDDYDPDINKSKLDDLNNLLIYMY